MSELVTGGTGVGTVYCAVDGGVGVGGMVWVWSAGVIGVGEGGWEG